MAQTTGALPESLSMVEVSTDNVTYTDISGQINSVSLASNFIGAGGLALTYAVDIAVLYSSIAGNVFSGGFSVANNKVEDSIISSNYIDTADFSGGLSSSMFIGNQIDREKAVRSCEKCHSSRSKAQCFGLSSWNGEGVICR